MLRLTRFALLAASLLAAAALAGCNRGNHPTDPTPAARVLTVHASPDAPAVDLLVDGTVAGSGLTFPNNTGYLDVKPGRRNIKVNVAGTSTTVIDATLQLSPGASYSVFAAGDVAHIAPLVLTDDLTKPAAGNAHVRFVHLSPDAPAVDIAVKNGPVLFANTSFKGYTAFAPVAAGTYDLEVRLAGTNTVALDLPGIALAPGRIYTVFARGFAAGSGAQALGAQIIVNR